MFRVVWLTAVTGSKKSRSSCREGTVIPRGAGAEHWSGLSWIESRFFASSRGGRERRRSLLEPPGFPLPQGSVCVTMWLGIPRARVITLRDG